jgi:hypothetical protein
MSFVLANFIRTTVAAPFGSGSTTLQVSSSTGLPTLAAGEILPITLTDAATGNISEIVYCTAIAGANLTVERAQEGTAALDWDIGDKVNCTPTAETVEPAGTAKVINVWQATPNTTFNNATISETINPATTPTAGNGLEVSSITFTPKESTSSLRVTFNIPCISTNSGSSLVAALYNMTTSTFIKGTVIGIINPGGQDANYKGPLTWIVDDISSFSGEAEFSICLGSGGGATINPTAFNFGKTSPAQAITMTIEEITVNA